MCACSVTQSYLTLRTHVACSPPGSSVIGILQARVLAWVPMPSSKGSSQPRNWTHVSVSPALAGRFLTTRATWEAHKTSQRLICQIDSLEKVPLFVYVTFQLPYSVAEARQAHSTINVCLLFVCQECWKLWAETRVSRCPARSPPQPWCHCVTT